MVRSAHVISVGDCLARIRDKYLEVPELNLTLSEAQRAWGLDEVTSSLLFEVLVDLKFLKQTQTGRYVRGTTTRES